MRSPAFVPSILFALASNNNNVMMNSSPNVMCWYIDGNNMISQRGIPKERDHLMQRLQGIQQEHDVQVIFDGRKGVTDRTVKEHKKEDGSLFSVIYLEEGMTTDNYILNEIETILQDTLQEERQDTLDEQRRRTATTTTRRRRKGQIQVVTADRELRRRSLAAKRVVRDVVNPITFWRRYVPRLTGMKGSKSLNDQGAIDDNNAV